MNKAVRIAMDILADYKYIYDPDHNSKPAGSWKQTGSGWSKHDVVDEPARSVVSQPAKKEERTTVKEAEPALEPEEKATPPSPEQKPAEPVKNEQPSEEEKAEAPEAERKPETPAEEEKPAVPEDGNSEAGEGGSEGGEDEKQDSPPSEDEGGDLFENPEDGNFETDEKGKEEEQGEEGNMLDLGVDDSQEDNGVFDDSNKDEYVNPDKYDENIEKMNSFIEKFDEGEGKENDVTFKAIAANLDWSSVEDVKAFADHCEKKGVDGADDVLAFLYFTHQDDEEKFDKIVEDMK